MVKNHAAKAAARKLKAESGITYPRALDMVRAAGYGSIYPALTIGLAFGAPVMWQPRPGSRLEIAGAAGTGKSQLMAFMATQAAAAGSEVHILDLDKGGPDYAGIGGVTVAVSVDDALDTLRELASTIRPAILFLEGIPSFAPGMEEVRLEIMTAAAALTGDGYAVVSASQSPEPLWADSERILLGASVAGQRAGFFGGAVKRSAAALEGHYLAAGKQEPMLFELYRSGDSRAYTDVYTPVTGRHPRFHDLHLPEAVRNFVTVEPGLYVFAGLIGSGRSTSMAAVVNCLTRRYARRVTVIGSDLHPLEILPGLSEVQYRMVPGDEGSMTQAVEEAVREVRDVIVIDDLIRGSALAAALRAAKAGHTVFLTLHAESAADVPQMIIERVSKEPFPHIEAALAEVLKGVLFQTLVTAADGHPAVFPAVEMLPVHDGASALIRALDYKGLSGFVSKQEQGCIPLSVSLSQLVLDGKISEHTAEKATGNPMEFRRALHAGKRHSNPYIALGTDTDSDQVKFFLGGNSHLVVVSADGRRRAAALDAIAGRFRGGVTRVDAGDTEATLVAIRQDMSETIRTVRENGNDFNALPLEARREWRCVVLDISPAMQAGEGSAGWTMQLIKLHREARMAGVTLLLGVEIESQLMLLNGAFQTMDGRMYLDGAASYSPHPGSTVQFSPDWESETAAA